MPSAASGGGGNQYSMMWREPEQGCSDLCTAMNIAFVAYSPLGNGFLSGVTRDTVNGEGDFRGFHGEVQAGSHGAQSGPG